MHERFQSFCRGTGIVFLSGLLASTAVAAPPVSPHEDIPGASPEPMTEGQGLRSPEDLEAFFDGAMKATLESQHVAGATVAVVKDGKLFFAKGYGYSDVARQTPVDAETTLFRPGSVSKLFTWTALMQLVEQGKVNLDADVNTYLTHFKIPATFPEPVTVRNLLTHTAGFEDGLIGWGWATGPEKLRPFAEVLQEHMPARVRAPATNFNDATMASYSNWGAGLAGVIIENVSGMSFDDYVETNIFAPLGMASTTFREPLPPALAPHMSTGYKFESGAFEPQSFEWIHNIAPAGSSSTTATDIAKFMIAHLNNGVLGDARILKEDTARLMHSRQLSPSPYLNGADLGFYETYINGRRLISHDGDTEYFHSGLNLYLEQNLGIFVSYNTEPTFQISDRHALLVAFMDRYFPAKLPQITPPTDFASRVDRYAGYYRFDRENYTNNEKALSFASGITVVPTKDNALLVSILLSSMQWKMIEVKPGVFRDVNSDWMIGFSDDNSSKAQFILDPLALTFISAYRVHAYETLPFQLGVLAFCLLSFVVAIVSAARHWRLDRRLPGSARFGRKLAGLAGLVDLCALIGIAIAFALLAKDPVSGWPPMFLGVLALPLIAIPLTIGVVVVASALWFTGGLTIYARVQYSAIALGLVAFLWVLNYWNLVGYRYG